MKCLLPILLVVLFTAAPVHAKDCKAAQRNACNVLLLLDNADQTHAEATHLLYGIPTAPLSAVNERLLHQTEYIINYDTDLLVPTWVAYRLHDTDIQERERLDCFRPDPRLLGSDSAQLDDYKEDNQLSLLQRRMKIKDITEWSEHWSTPSGTMYQQPPVANGVLAD